ncbi:MAG: hypothetical protein RLZZ156_2443 [Deinococcota bacterium]|jgi:predicted ATPase
MISQLSTKNYRNLESGQISLKSLNILIGSNGSGKSNFVDILKFFHNALAGNLDSRRGVTRFESAIADFGSGTILNSDLQEPAYVDLTINFQFHKAIEEISVGLEVSNAFEVNIGYEIAIRKSLGEEYSAQSYYYKFSKDTESKSNFITLRANKRVTREKMIRETNQELAFNFLPKWFEENSSKIKGSPMIFAVRQNILSSITNWGFYESANMNLSDIRKDISEITQGDMILSQSGSNLCLVLFNLSNIYVDFRDELLFAMQELFPKTRRLDVVATNSGTPTIQWFLGDSKKPFSPRRMSDGTVRMLCWAAVLLSPRLPTLIVLDEPEAGLHPAWLKVLAGWIGRASQRTQVIVSTHSPDLLDHFTDVLENVLVFDRSQNEGISTVKSLTRAELQEDLNSGWKLGDLYRVGHPKVGGWAW